MQELSTRRRFPVSTSIEGGRAPRWSTDGSEIFYSTRGAQRILLAEWDAETLAASEPEEVSDIPMRPPPGVQFDVTADGQRLLVLVPAGSGDTGDTAPGPRINVILNWFEELKQRVPTGGSR